MGQDLHNAYLGIPDAVGATGCHGMVGPQPDTLSIIEPRYGSFHVYRYPSGFGTPLLVGRCTTRVAAEAVVRLLSL